MNFHLRLIVALTILFEISGCGILKKKEEAPNSPSLQAVASKPLPPEQAQSVMSEAGQNWLYGQGFGATAVNVGGIVLFPPYAVYVLGNALIGAAGYEELYVTKLLPKEDEDHYNAFYGSVVSVPGRVAASMAGKEYRTPEVAKERLNGALRSAPPSEQQ